MGPNPGFPRAIPPHQARMLATRGVAATLSRARPGPVAAGLCVVSVGRGNGDAAALRGRGQAYFFLTSVCWVGIASGAHLTPLPGLTYPRALGPPPPYV